MNLAGRQKDTLDCEASQCVSAGAGTGKTTTLAAKYLKLLDKTKTSSSILALTFTDKAAASMKEKIRKELSKLSHGSEEALEDFNWSTIMTFHSFCAQVLRDNPLETGVNPDFVLLEEGESRALMESAFEDLMRTEDQSVRKALLDVMTEVEGWRLEENLPSIYRSRHITGPLFKQACQGGLDELTKKVCTELLASAIGALARNDDFANSLHTLKDLAAKPNLGTDKGSEVLIELRKPLISLSSELEPREALAEVHRIVRGSRSGIGSKDVFSAEEKERLNHAIASLKEGFESSGYDLARTRDNPALGSRVGEFLISLDVVSDAFARMVQRRKDERNALDFEDMLIMMRDQVTRDKEFARRLGSQYRYVLVDEMQDTDVLQLEIIKAIIGDERPCHRLFVVGDPKQSIYLFREADVTLFKDARKYVEEMGGTHRALNINYRSTPDIICFVNSLFSRLLSSEVNAWDFKYEPVSVSDRRRNDRGAVELHLLTNTEDGDDRKATEGEMVAKLIRDIVDRGDVVYHDVQGERLEEGRAARFSDITILMRARTNLPYFEQALKKAGIPYRVHRGQGYYSQREVIDAYQLLRFLLDRNDDAALYGLLRSPYFGFSEEELFRIGNGRRGPWFSRLKREGAADARANAACVRLERWLHYARWEPVADLLMRIISESGIYAVYGGLTQGDEMIANLEKLQQRVRSRQSTGFTTLHDVVSDLEENIWREAREGEAQIKNDDANAVHIMTVHAAKGLEFPIVVVPEIDRERSANYERIEVDRHMGIGVQLTDPRTMDKQPDAAMERMKRVGDTKHEAENRRLFYVSATRAMDRLVMTAYCEDPEKVEEKCGGDCWLHYLLRSLDVKADAVAAGGMELADSCGNKTWFGIQVHEPEDSLEKRVPKEYRVPGVLRSMPERPASRAVEIEENLSPSRSHSREGGIMRLNGRPELDWHGWDDLSDSRTRGLVVHAVFQGRPARVVLKEHGVVDEEMAHKIEAQRDRFFASDLMKNAARTHPELSFQMMKKDQRVNGRMDLLVENTDGSYSLIDFKTGTPTEANIGEYVGRYAKQLWDYGRAVEGIVGVKPRLFLYFTSNEMVREVPFESSSEKMDEETEVGPNTTIDSVA